MHTKCTQLHQVYACIHSVHMYTKCTPVHKMYTHIPIVQMYTKCTPVHPSLQMFHIESSNLMTAVKHPVYQYQTYFFIHWSTLGCFPSDVWPLTCELRAVPAELYHWWFKKIPQDCHCRKEPIPGHMWTRKSVICQHSNNLSTNLPCQTYFIARHTDPYCINSKRFLTSRKTDATWNRWKAGRKVVIYPHLHMFVIPPHLSTVSSTCLPTAAGSCQFFFLHTHECVSSVSLSRAIEWIYSLLPSDFFIRPCRTNQSSCTRCDLFKLGKGSRANKNSQSNFF